MTREQVGRLVAILKAAFPKQPMPPATVEFYVLSLSDLDYVEAEAAVRRLTRRVSFLPTVAEVRIEVGDAKLGLPSAAAAWDIARSGALSQAPVEVREAVEAVGGRWAILHSENPIAVRAQFWRDYEQRRERAVLEEIGAVEPRLSLVNGDGRAQISRGIVEELAESERIRPRAVIRRELKRLAGGPFDPPSDEERRDAIAILRDGSFEVDPADDALYKAAELVMVDADRETAS